MIFFQHDSRYLFLLLVLTALMARTSAQNTISPDTLWVSGADCFLLGDPNSFTIMEAETAGRYYLGSEIGFSWLLDSNLQGLSSSPLYEVPKAKRPFLPISVAAFTDSLWLVAWEDFYGMGRLPDQKVDRSCPGSPQLLGTGKKGLAPRNGFALSLQRVLPLRKVADGKWWLYSPTRLDDHDKVDFPDSLMPPFRVFEVSLQNRKWRVTPLEVSTDQFPIAASSLQSKSWLGWSTMIGDGDGFWWADTQSPFVYFIDALGIKHDSVRIANQLPSPYLHSTYDPKHGDHWNWQQMRMSTTYFGAIIRGEKTLSRLFWTGAEGHWNLLVYEFYTQKLKEISMPKDIEIGGFGFDRIYFTGTKIGDRLAFPYVSISELVEGDGH